jgi:hypothetical protein
MVPATGFAYALPMRAKAATIVRFRFIVIRNSLSSQFS